MPRLRICRYKVRVKRGLPNSIGCRAINQSCQRLSSYTLVNVSCPAPIETPMVQNTDECQKKKYSNFDIAVVMFSGISMNRLSDPDEVASAILFLASEHSGVITGAGLHVVGGVLAK
ncbi:MAG: SDR family oxidoreductase [Porticoccaceae bacterium]|nr:SDR family oxidoreductase [Porticoccaceae bacterium]